MSNSLKDAAQSIKQFLASNDKVVVREQHISVYGVFDSKAAIFVEYFPCKSDGVAQRAFSDRCVAVGADGRPNGPLALHPEDYILFRIAEFDSVKGQFANYPTPDNLGIGSSFVDFEKSPSK